MGHWHSAPQIPHTDTTSANANITAATQISHTDTSSANTNITAATQITHIDTTSANTNITAATQISHTDTSSANTNITAATQITHIDTTSANANITAAPLLNLTRFRDRSRPTRHCGEPYGVTADGCGRLPTVANGCSRKRKTWRTQPHPQTPKWNGNPRYAFGKSSPEASGETGMPGCFFTWLPGDLKKTDPRETNSMGWQPVGVNQKTSRSGLMASVMVYQLGISTCRRLSKSIHSSANRIAVQGPKGRVCPAPPPKVQICWFFVAACCETMWNVLQCCNMLQCFFVFLNKLLLKVNPCVELHLFSSKNMVWFAYAEQVVGILKTTIWEDAKSDLPWNDGGIMRPYCVWCVGMLFVSWSSMFIWFIWLSKWWCLQLQL